jgi:hypothetical protein
MSIFNYINKKRSLKSSTEYFGQYLRFLTNIIFHLFCVSIILIYFVLVCTVVVFAISNYLTFSVPDSSTAANFSVATVTAILALITCFYAWDNNKMVKISRNTQEIMYLQRKLEKLYYPLKITLNRNSDINIEKLKSVSYVLMFRKDLNEIIPYLYLSSKELNIPLDRFVSIFDKNGLLIKEEQKEAIINKRGETPSETLDAECKLLEMMLATIPTTNWECLTDEEIEEVLKLYEQIIKMINKDIPEYCNRLNELTANQNNSHCFY